MYLCQTHQLTKRFGRKTALDELTVGFRDQSVIGLVGLNGSGKTTLLRHLIGMYQPTAGRVEMLGVDALQLGADQLSRIGMVHQENQFLEWMVVGDQLRYAANFYPSWNPEVERHLVREFDLDLDARVGTLSPGNLQKLAIILAVSYVPEVLLLDEPASALDPITRNRFFKLILGLLDMGIRTVVISSHILTDIEKSVDHIVCLHRGKLAADMSVDELYESYAAWTLQTSNPLPEHFEEAYVLRAQVGQGGARLMVDTRSADARAFAARYGVTPQVSPLNLEQIFPLLIGEDY